MDSKNGDKSKSNAQRIIDIDYTCINLFILKLPSFIFGDILSFNNT